MVLQPNSLKITFNQMCLLLRDRGNNKQVYFRRLPCLNIAGDQKIIHGSFGVRGNQFICKFVRKHSHGNVSSLKITSFSLQISITILGVELGGNANLYYYFYNGKIRKKSSVPHVKSSILYYYFITGRFARNLACHVSHLQFQFFFKRKPSINIVEFQQPFVTFLFKCHKLSVSFSFRFRFPSVSNP